VKNLRDMARGRECLIRVPLHCIGGTETVVLCHYRIAGMSGMGLKSPDWCGAYGCYACHQIVDGQRNSTFTADERELMLVNGVIRTLAMLIEEGRIKV